ncbi:putative glycolipid-binding domain-containing protein [Nocardia brevicatena]|uniref:putative glycolipid-binding domain-containing protein n=1 Tax=Nocardia brevicatena TaxID=37327 RepID=UPI0002E63FE1|nr:putative glycolipid-binding domain-containing protein [Nocardia brevicatena]
MGFAELPTTAAWAHEGGRSGFEVAYFATLDRGRSIEGCTTAVEDGETWFVEYAITLNADWTTCTARVTGHSSFGRRSITLEGDGAGHWLLDGRPAPHLDGCRDVDLESSAMTNTLPVHRLGLPVAERAAAPAAYVRASDLTVHRLEQEYRRIPDRGADQRYDYNAPAFDFTCHLVYDRSGLILSYPGIAVRAA